MGAFPTRLADFIGFAGAATELTSLYSEDAQTRAGAIAALDDYDLSGLTITDGGATVAAVTISETEYSVTVGNTSLTLLGQGLPAGDLGTVLDAGVQLLNDDIRDAGGQLDLDPLTALDIQSLDRLTLTVDDEDFLVVEGPITPGNIDADNVVTFDVIGSDDDDQLWLTPDNDELDDADVSIQAGLGDDVVGIGIEIDEGELAFNNGNWTGRSASLQNYFSSMHVDGGDDWDYLFVGFSVSWWDDYIVDLNSDDKGSVVRSLSFYDISTHVDLQLGSIVVQDAYTNETAEVTFDNFEYVNVGVYGSLSVTGSDDWDRLEITGNPLSLDIDMGDGVDTLYLHRLDRFDEEGYFSDDIGITRAEFMDEFDFTLNGDILDVSLVDGDTSVTVATLTSVERVGFKSEDGSGVDRHRIDQLLAEENAVDGVATLNATDGDDDIVALNFTGQSSDIDVFDVNLMDGHDWVEIKLNDGAVTDASITKITGMRDMTPFIWKKIVEKIIHYWLLILQQVIFSILTAQAGNLTLKLPMWNAFQSTSVAM